MKGNPLRKEEVAPEIRDAYDFHSQRIEFHPVKKKRVMTIQRTCLRCGKQDQVPVVYVRSSIREKTLTGLCLPCALSTVPRRRIIGKDHWLWKGGKITTRSGYIMLRCTDHPNAKNGYEFEHRLVMEQNLRRYLLPNETVHHKNGVKDDNRIENLELFSGNHGNGVRYEDMTIKQLKTLLCRIKKILEAKQNDVKS